MCTQDTKSPLQQGVAGARDQNGLVGHPAKGFDAGAAQVLPQRRVY